MRTVATRHIPSMMATMRNPQANIKDRRIMCSRSSSCITAEAGTAPYEYGKMVLALAIINMLFGFLELVCHGLLYCYLSKNKKLPDWLVGSFGDGAASQSKVKPVNGVVAEGE